MSKLSDLLDGLGLTLADLDSQEQSKQTGFLKLLQNLAKSRGKSLQTGDQNASTRGILQSGIALKQQVDTNTAYDGQLATATDDNNAALSAIAKARLAAQANYNLRKAELEAAAANTADPSTLAANGAQSSASSQIVSTPEQSLPAAAAQALIAAKPPAAIAPSASKPPVVKKAAPSAVVVKKAAPPKKIAPSGSSNPRKVGVM
jgi:hypothetical protein